MEIANYLGSEVLRHERSRGEGAAVKTLFQRNRELGLNVIVALGSNGQRGLGKRCQSWFKPFLKGKPTLLIVSVESFIYFSFGPEDN